MEVPELVVWSGGETEVPRNDAARLIVARSPPFPRLTYRLAYLRLPA